MLYAKDIATDWVKVGTMLSVTHWLGGGSILSKSWQKMSLYTLLGFTAYHVTTRGLLTPQGLSGKTKAVADDVIKMGTMLVVSRLLSGGSLADQNWIRSTIAILIGFVVYNILTVNYIKGKEVSHHPKLRDTVDDWAKFGTMLLVSRLISCESVLDSKWIISSLNTLIGFSTYDIVTSHVVDAVFDEY